jgi:hypothetical protein
VIGSRRRIIAIVVAVAVLLPVAQIVRINWKSMTRRDAPLSFRPDKRLAMLKPKQEAKVNLPVKVDWKSRDFALRDGNQFGVFIDTAIPRPGDYLRVRLCTRLGELPPAPGDFRGLCKDQRDQISFTTKHSASFKCFEPHFERGKRRMNDHTVTVVLLDKDLRRIGEAAANVMFRVDAKDAKKCRGFDAE